MFTHGHRNDDLYCADPLLQEDAVCWLVLDSVGWRVKARKFGSRCPIDWFENKNRHTAPNLAPSMKERKASPQSSARGYITRHCDVCCPTMTVGCRKNVIVVFPRKKNGGTNGPSEERYLCMGKSSSLNHARASLPYQNTQTHRGRGICGRVACHSLAAAYRHDDGCKAIPTDHPHGAPDPILKVVGCRMGHGPRGGGGEGVSHVQV